MKRSIKIILIITIAVLSLTALLTGCDLSRKVQGIELKFRNKLEKAEAFSFNIHLDVEQGATKSELDVSCYKKGTEYAYTFRAPNSADLYRDLFADNRMYEFCEYSSPLLIGAGSYYVNEGVAYTSDKNLLYTVTKNIMLASYATLLTTGKKDKVGDVDTYRYDFEIGGNSYSMWYDDENLVKISAIFRSADENGNTTSETYAATFSDYRFADVDSAPFRRPGDMTGAYIESPISFEDWMKIITQFSTRAANWM